MSHQAKTIDTFKTGLVLQQPKQILVDDAFPVLSNAFVYLNTVIRREGYFKLGRLQRSFSTVNYFPSQAVTWSFNLLVVSGYVASTDNGDPGQVTTTYPHGLMTGDEVIMSGMWTMPGYPNVTYTVTVVTPTTFTIGVNAAGFGSYTSGGYWISNRSIFATEPNAQLAPRTFTMTYGGVTIADTGGIGTLTSSTPDNSGTINYITGEIEITATTIAPGTPGVISFGYYPTLPAMGIFDRNVTNGFKKSIYFDTMYAYQLVQGSTTDAFQEFIPGTQWTLQDYTFPYPGNYWQDPDSGLPLFWDTNLPISAGGQPIRYTDGMTWNDFSPSVDGGTNFIFQAKALVPFRGMLIAFNTMEGTAIGVAKNYPQRVRTSQVGTPLPSEDTDAWNDTIPGKGYFEDLPTTETIRSVYLIGLNNIIIETDSKTWVLSYTGMNIAPFRIDLVDDELGSYSLFGKANMGLWAEGIGNRLFQKSSPQGVTNDDQKIVNFVYAINRAANGLDRVYACRNFRNRTVTYSYPSQTVSGYNVKFPNYRLLYNYENHSWAIFEDSFTCMGYFRQSFDLTWEDSNFPWEQADIPWLFDSGETQQLSAGNQQGYIFIIDSGQTYAPSLTISDITVNPNSAATFTSPDYNLASGTIVELTGFVGDLVDLNGLVGSLSRVSGSDTDFYIFQYDAVRDVFNDPIIISGSPDYVGGGEIIVRRNFNIQTKAYNNLKQGQSIHMSYLDALVNVEQGTSVQVNVYPFLGNDEAVNQYPQNQDLSQLSGNTLSLSNPTTYSIDSVNNRALINQRANMISLEFTLSNATMVSENYDLPFSMQSMTIWTRPAGRPLMPLGGG